VLYAESDNDDLPLAPPSAKARASSRPLQNRGLGVNFTRIFSHKKGLETFDTALIAIAAML